MTGDVHGNPYCEYVYLELKMIWYWWCFDNLYDISCMKDLTLSSKVTIANKLLGPRVYGVGIQLEVETSVFFC